MLKHLNLCLKLLRTAFRKDSLSRLVCLYDGFRGVKFRNCHQLYC